MSLSIPRRFRIKKELYDSLVKFKGRMMNTLASNWMNLAEKIMDKLMESRISKYKRVLKKVYSECSSKLYL